jgi:GntR family transcriptional regulator
MFVRVKRGSSVPISSQILEQVQAQILAGRLASGTQLPSVRQLANELGVNANTIVRVYERLSAEGLVEMRHGEGTFVLAKPSVARLERQKITFQEELLQLVRQAGMLGFTRIELRKLVDDAFASAAETSTGSSK